MQEVFPALMNKRFFLVVYVVIGVGLIAGGLVYYHSERNRIRSDKYEELAAIAELKTEQIQQWRGERLDDANRMASDPFVKIVADWLRDPDAPGLQEDLLARLKGEQMVSGHANVLLCDLEGRTLLAAVSGPESPASAGEQALKAAIAARQAVLSDFWRGPNGRVQIDAVAPVLSRSGRALAAVVLSCNADDRLYPLIQAWPTPSRSAETLIFRKEGDHILYLNDLRHQRKTALSLSLPLTQTKVPAVQAALGTQGMFQGRDYRGVEVLADLRPVPQTPWFMVAKVDAAEILAEAQYRAGAIGLFVLLLMLLVGAATAYFYRQKQLSMYLELYRIEQERASAQEQFRTILYSIGDGVITTDADGVVRRMNPEAERLTGWLEAEAGGRSITEIFPIINEDSQAAVEQPVERVLREGLVVGLANHTLLKGRDGTERPIGDSGAPVRDKDGTISGVVLVFRDQTEERAVQNVLRESEERYRNFVANANEGIYRVDFSAPIRIDLPEEEFIAAIAAHAVVGEVNEALARMYGLTPQDMVGRPAVDFAPDYGRSALQVCKARDHRMVEVETTDKDKKGRPLFLSESYQGIVEDNTLLRIWGVQRDITERKVLEAAQLFLVKCEGLANEDFFQALARYLAGSLGMDYVCIDRLEGDLLSATTLAICFDGKLEDNVTYALKDTPCGVVVEKKICIFPRDVRHLFPHDVVLQDMRAESYVGTILWGSSGQPIGLIAVVGRKPLENPRLAESILKVAAIRAAGELERTQAEESLRESETKYRALFETTPDALMMVDSNGFFDCNSATLKMFQYASLEDFITKHPGEFAPPVQPNGEDSMDGADAHIEKAFREGSDLFEWVHRKADGTTFPAEVLLNRVDLGGRVVVEALVRDISARKRAETERLELERQLLHGQKLESLGGLAGGIAHDFNNLLMGILGNLDLALQDLSLDSPVCAFIERAAQASHRAAELTRQMLAYSGKGRFVLQDVDLSGLVGGNAELFRTSLAKTATLTVNTAAEIPLISADLGQMQQMVMNLIINASEALGGETGTITMTTGEMECERAYLDRSRIEEKSPAGRYVFVEVRDTGCGMDDETQQRMFDPFFTTKFTGRGLGMSAVLGIIRGHRGAILVESEVGKGTCIQVLFPVSTKGAGHGREAGPRPAGRAEEPTAQRGTVLVVDDEEHVRALGASFVRRLGFEALEAGDGEEALQIFEEHAGEIGCVLLDLTMPRMDGVNAFRELKRLKPEVKVILCSGYSEEEATQCFTDEGLAGFLQKPYRLEDLKEEILAVLQEGHRGKD